jgi:hypothetical protein
MKAIRQCKNISDLVVIDYPIYLFSLFLVWNFWTRRPGQAVFGISPQQGGGVMTI